MRTIQEILTGTLSQAELMAEQRERETQRLQLRAEARQIRQMWEPMEVKAQRAKMVADITSGTPTIGIGVDLSIGQKTNG